MFKKITTTICVIFVLCLLIYSTVCTRKLNENRRLCNQYTEQLRAAEERNREFEDRFGRIQDVVGRLSETANSNIIGARDIIETVERLRAEVQELEDCCGSDNQREYYQYWDSYFGIE